MEKEHLSKQQQLNLIQRKFRINPPALLLDFWEELAKEKLSERIINYHFFTLTLLGVEKVANYDVREIRHWFKHKSKIRLVKYFIPIGESLDDQAVFVAGFDSSKRYVGIFSCNLSIDPIFITNKPNDLLSNQENKLSKSEFLKKNVSKVLLWDNKLEGLSEEFDDSEIMELVGQDFMSFLEFIKNGLSFFSYPDSMNFNELKTTYKIVLKESPTNSKTNQLTLSIPKTESYELDNKILVANTINMFFENNGVLSTRRFYRTDQGFSLLHDEQLLEFTRKGIIPLFENIKFPCFLYSNQESGYRGKEIYEVKTFETVEEMSAWEKAYLEAPFRISVQEMTVKDIESVVDYFLDASSDKLLEDGIDEFKILTEEGLTNRIKKEIEEEFKKRERHYFNWSVDDKIRGYSYIDKIVHQQEAYFHFYRWDSFLAREKIIDELMLKTLIKIKEEIGLNYIFSEQGLTDDYRNGILRRAGFKQIDEYETVRDYRSNSQRVNKWVLDLKEYQ